MSARACCVAVDMDHVELLRSQTVELASQRPTPHQSIFRVDGDVA